MRQDTIFFAGGTKGPNARADGNGGLMARGWYVERCSTGGTVGPFRTKTQAKELAGPRCFEKPVNKREPRT